MKEDKLCVALNAREVNQFICENGDATNLPSCARSPSPFSDELASSSEFSPPSVTLGIVLD